LIGSEEGKVSCGDYEIDEHVMNLSELIRGCEEFVEVHGAPPVENPKPPEG
jgi:hypothetical protein